MGDHPVSSSLHELECYNGTEFRTGTRRFEMSTSRVIEQIEYPETDGKPMGETDLHREWMIRILQLFQHRYRDQRVYIASDLLVYYEEGSPTKFVVPDVMVVLDCAPGRRRTFKTWAEERLPDFVLEVTSRGTSSVDIIDKPAIYERIGVKEYFLYDPTAEYLNPPLQGYRLTDGVLTEIEKCEGVLRSETLGIELSLSGTDLQLSDCSSGARLLSEAESERAARFTEQAAKESERSARLEAEAKLRELQEELDRLKREGS